jgi:hypothetical protein
MISAPEDEYRLGQLISMNGLSPTGEIRLMTAGRTRRLLPMVNEKGAGLACRYNVPANCRSVDSSIGGGDRDRSVVLPPRARVGLGLRRYRGALRLAQRRRLDESAVRAGHEGV